MGKEVLFHYDLNCIWKILIGRSHFGDKINMCHKKIWCNLVDLFHVPSTITKVGFLERNDGPSGSIQRGDLLS